MTEAVMTCAPGLSVGKIERQARKTDRADDDFADQLHSGTPWPERPTQVIDWCRASCIRPKLTAATAPTQGRSHVRRDTPHIAAAMDQGGDDVGGGEERRELSARNQLHVAQRGAFPTPRSRAATPANSPPGSRAEINRL